MISRADILRKRQQDHAYETERQKQISLEQYINEEAKCLIRNFEKFYISKTTSVISFESDPISVDTEEAKENMKQHIWKNFLSILEKDGWDLKQLELNCGVVALEKLSYNTSLRFKLKVTFTTY